MSSSYVSEQIYPTPQAGSIEQPVDLRVNRGTGRDVEAAWRLLISSAYMDETSPQLRHRQREGFIRHWQDVERETGSNRLALVRQGRSCIATAAASELYCGTWMIHHMGIDAECRKDRQVKYSASSLLFRSLTEWIEEVADADTIMVICDRRKHFNELLYRSYARSQADEDCSVRDFEVRKNSLFRKRWVIVSHNSASKIIADDPPLLALLEDIVRTSIPAVEAMGWARFRQPSTTCGNGRQRRVFFSVDRYGPTAALVCDSGDIGVNLFSLLNTCRLVPMRSGVEVATQVIEDLFGVAMDYYRSRGVSEIVFLDDHIVPRCAADEELLTRFGFGSPIPGMCFAVDRSRFESWRDHIETTFAGRISATR